MRFIATFAVGLLIGIVAGLWVAGPGTEPTRRNKLVVEPAGATPVASIPTDSSVAIEGTHESPASARPGPLFLRYSGSPAQVQSGVLFIAEGEVVGGHSQSVADLRGALSRARAEQDWGAFRAALIELGEKGTPEAQTVLVEVMGDETLRLIDYWLPQAFYLWLKDSDVEGILAAAMRRWEVEAQESGTAVWSRLGWLSLIACDGGPGELRWIESLGRREHGLAVAQAASNPLAADMFANWLKQADPNQKLTSNCYDAFARENPGAAFEAAVQGLAVSPTDSELLRLLGMTATAKNLDRVHEALSRLASHEERLLGLTVLRKLLERGIDISSFKPVLDAPRSLLERPPSENADVDLLLRAISAASWTYRWSDGTWEALTRLQEHPNLRVARSAKGAAESVQRVTWDPERGG